MSANPAQPRLVGEGKRSDFRAILQIPLSLPKVAERTLRLSLSHKGREFGICAIVGAKDVSPLRLFYKQMCEF